MRGVLREVPEITNDQNMCCLRRIVTEGVQIHCYGVFIGMRQSCGSKGGRGARQREKLTEKHENKRKN